MKVFYKLCINPPHSNQLNHYGKNGKIQVTIYKKRPSNPNETDETKKKLPETKIREEKK
jgi:hypothetical protein